jgi:hypothetical protein
MRITAAKARDSRPDETTVAELLPVGEGAWCACDARLAPNDPRRVIAFVQLRDQEVEVVWVREARPTTWFASLPNALRAVDLAADAGRPRAEALP